MDTNNGKSRIPQKRVIETKALSDTLDLTLLCDSGYWLYDNVLKVNLAMRAETVEAALINALMYYQKRLEFVETRYNILRDKVQNFHEQVEDYT